MIKINLLNIKDLNKVKKRIKVKLKARELRKNWTDEQYQKYIKYQKEYHKTHPRKTYSERDRLHNLLKTKYGISYTQYKDLLFKQNFVCLICKGPPIGKRRLSVDHCHKTGKIRGLLCNRCNILIGQCKENTDILKKAISYLEVNNGL